VTRVRPETINATFGILGPTVATVGGQTVDLGPPKQRALLAFFLLHPNRVITSERILEELWGEAAFGKDNALWVYISRLRSLFEPDRTARGESSILLTKDHGYVLNVDPASIDAFLFEQEASRGHELARTDPAAAAELLSHALGLWRGDALQDVTYEEFSQSEITHLEELRLSAIEDRIECGLDQGQARELIGELESLREAEPLRERPVSQLMTALYRSGRHADALRAFERFRRRLGSEIGIEPSAELRRLEEQILVQDPRLKSSHAAPTRRALVADAVVNPFKGLRTFGEDDASIFFGRERLVADVLRRIDDGTRLIALVGPSGSGKSSLVKAGVIPALRKGGSSGAETWSVAQMVPGSHPFAELEVALLRSSLDVPDSLRDLLAVPETGLLRAALRVLPDGDSRLLLVVDQFEELFTLVDDEETRARFLDQLIPALDDPHGRIVVVVTLRSDFYGQPLVYPRLGARLGEGVINVVPLLPDELESAAQQPLAQANIGFQPALLATLLADVVGQPGALPLFQFSLTELFDRRIDDTLTLDIYREMGGVEGAITRTADDIYDRLEDKEKAAAKQLFLRLIAIADGDGSGRRRVLASEITALDVDLVVLQKVISAYTQNRLLTLDRDQVADSPAIEVAHEALLTEWERLRGWIESARDDIRRHAAFRSAMVEWVEADQARDYLLSGSRLDVYEKWASASEMQLTSDEQKYLQASIEVRDEIESAEAERVATERRLATAARRRLWVVVTLIAVVVAGSAVLIAMALAGEPAQVAVLMPNLPEEQEGLTQTGLERAERELNVQVADLSGRFTDLETKYRELAEDGVDLIFMDNGTSGFEWVEEVVADYPDTAFVVINGILAPAGARAIYFADEEAGYIAGAAAALTTETGIVGFVGNYQSDTSERWRAGFEAGALATRPDVEVLSIYTITEGSRSVEEGRASGEVLFEQDADVVLAFAGDATAGVIEAAYNQGSQIGAHRWVIGSESDWSLGLEPHLRPQVLTSAIRQWDVAVFETINDYLDEGLKPGISTLGLDRGAMGLARSEHLTAETLTDLERLSSPVAEGLVTIPRAPTGEVLPPPGVVEAETATLTWDGENCTYTDSGVDLKAGTTLRIEFVNDTSEYWFFWARRPGRGIPISTLVQPNAENSGYITLHPGTIDFSCGSEIRDKPRAEVFKYTVLGHTLTVGP
jgi:basic membrane lipoprotein Med (substrate-binding protein (PBP1-ABC) superfamily)/DNA-binding SARP family transcriptional activator